VRGKGKVGRLKCREKIKREARGKGWERWACDNVMKKGKGGEERGKGKVGM
jgi:hypothetical protein